MKLHRGILVLNPSLRLPAGTLQALRDAGYIPIVGRPEQVQSRLPLGAPLDGNMLTHASLAAIMRGGDYIKKTFAELVLESLMRDLGYVVIDGKLVKRGATV